jgi:PAS domain S-box-containing protein
MKKLDLSSLGWRTLKGKLIFIQVILFILLVAMVALTTIQLNNIKQQLAINQAQLSALNLDLIDAAIHKTLLVATEPEMPIEAEVLLSFWSDNYPQVLKTLEQNKTINNFLSLKRDAQLLSQGIKGIEDIIGNDLSNQTFTYGNLNPSSRNLAKYAEVASQGLQSLKLDLKNYTEEEKEVLLDSISSLSQLMLFLSFILFGSVLGLGLSLNNQIGQIFKQLRNTVSELRHGNIPKELPDAHNETSAIYEELNAFFGMLETVQLFSKEVGEGKFDSTITVFDNKGELGKTLNDMKESLRQVAVEDKERNWVNSGFAKFGDILRSSHDDIEKLSDDLLSNLVKYIDANQGAIFLIDKDSEHSEQMMKAIACYAYNRKKKIGEEVRKGEGLIGAAWQEKDTIYLTDIPDDYVNIRSGLGGANPKSILIQPLVNNEEIVGALEMASFEDFKPFQIEFIKKLSETIAATISTVYTNSKTKALLEESKQMAEEMKAQEEELRQNMEELEATQEEMRRAQDQIKIKEANLSALIDNTDDTIFALDTSYNITVVNKTLHDKYIKQGIDLTIGKNIFDVIPKEMHAYWKERYDRALGGEKFVKVEERGGGEKVSYVETHHNPIKNQVGAIIGCSVIAKDVTELYTIQKEIKKKESILNTLINNTDDTFFALDKEYRITVINKALKDRFEATGITMSEGDYIFDILPKESHAFWKEKYDRSLGGEAFEYEQERPVNERVLYLKAYSRPVFDEEGNVIGASVQSRDITESTETGKENQELKLQLVGLKERLGIELTAEEKEIAASSK